MLTLLLTTILPNVPKTGPKKLAGHESRLKETHTLHRKLASLPGVQASTFLDLRSDVKFQIALGSVLVLQLSLNLNRARHLENPNRM